MRAGLTVLFFIFTALALALGGCGASGANGKPGRLEAGAPKEATGAPAEGKKAPRLYPVRARAVASRPVQYHLQAIGSIEAQDVYQIDARVPGTLYDVNFNEGDAVNPDQVLCKVAPEAYHQAALKAEAQYRQGIAQLADIRRRLENAIQRNEIKLAEAKLEMVRRKTVREAGAISDEEIQIYESRHNLAALELKDAKQAQETEPKVLEALIAEREAQWKIAQEDERKSIVKAPIPGLIEKRMVTNGMFATAGMPLATIVDVRALKLRFKVSEKDSSAVRIGTVVTFSVPAWPLQEFEAAVYHLAGQLEAESRVLACYAKVTRGAEKLKPGYFASVKIVTANKEAVIVVPAIAVLPTEKGFVAYVVKDGKAEKRLLQVGMSVADNEVEVLSGLQAGEMLVVEGGNALQDGVGVRVMGE